jgi:hypothetical protein
MSKLDTNFVKQLYSSKGVELTPEKLQYISENYASNEELESSFNMKYSEPQEPKTDPEKKNQNSTTTSTKTPSVSPTQQQKRKPTSVGGKPLQTGASASSAGKGKEKKSFEDTNVIYINKDPKRGEVDDMSTPPPAGYRYQVVQNSAQLKKWKEQKTKVKEGSLFGEPVQSFTEQKSKEFEGTKKKEEAKKQSDLKSMPVLGQDVKLNVPKADLNTTDMSGVKKTELKPITKTEQVSKNQVVNVAYDYAVNNLDTSLSEQKYEDEVNEKQFTDGVKQGMINVYNVIANPLSSITNLDLVIKKSKPLDDQYKEIAKIEQKEKVSYSPELKAKMAKDMFIEEENKKQMYTLIDKALPSGYDTEGIWKELKLQSVKSNEQLRKTIASAEVFKGKINQFNDFFKENYKDLDKIEGSNEDKGNKYVFEIGGKKITLSESKYQEYEKLRQEAIDAKSKLESMSLDIDKIYNKASKDDELLDLFKYNYNDFQATKGRILGGIGEIIGGGLKLLGEGSNYAEDIVGLAPGLSMIPGVSDKAIEIGNTLLDMSQEEKEQYLRYNASDLTWDNLPSFGLQLFSEQLPILLSIGLAGPGGLAAVSAGSGGRQFRDLEIEEKNNPFIRYSQGQKLTSALLYGGAEYAGEFFGTRVLLKGFGNTIRNGSLQSRRLFYDGMIKSTIKSLPKVATGAGVEGGSELATGLMQIGTDLGVLGKDIKSKEAFERLYEQGFSGAFMGGGMAVAANNMQAVAAQAKVFSSRKDMMQVGKLLNEIDALNQELNNNPLLSEEDKAIIYKDMNAKTNEAFDIVAKNSGRESDFSISEKAELLSINANQIELKEEYDKINSSNINDKLKKQKIDDLNKKFNALEGKRNDILNKTYNAFNYLPEEEQTKLKLEAAEAIIQEQVDKGIEKDNIQEPNAEVINKKAKELYNQKIQEDAKTKQTDGKITNEEKPTTTNKEQAVSTAQQKSNVELQEEVDNNKLIGLEPNGGVDANVDKFETYSGNKFEITLTNVDENGNALPRGDGNKKITIKTIKSDGTVRVNNALTKTFKTAAEAKEYANKFIEKDQQKDKNTNVKKEVDKLRAEELNELTENVENPEDFITDGKVDAKKVSESDNAKAKEIYAKYDAKIKPLLDNIKTQEDAVQKQEVDEINKKRAVYGLEPLKPTYRGTSISEWESVKKGEKFKSKDGFGENKANVTWVSDKKEYSEGYITSDDTVLVEFKPEAIDKSTKESGQENDDTGVRLGRDLDINDVQKVTDSKGNIIYESPKAQEDAVQKQSTNEGVLQPGQSEMGLQEVEQRDTKQEVVTEQGQKEKVKLQEDVKKASDRLSKAYDAYKNIGIVFDPEGNWKKDKELVSSLVDFAVSNIKFGAYNAKVLIEDLAKKGIEISKENAKYIFDKANRKFKSDINKAVGIKPKATEQKRINKAFGVGVATQKVETEVQKEKVKSAKEELSTAKKEIQDVFSAAKEALKIEKDKNKVINKLKVDANAFIKASITDLKAGDIGNRAITSIASKIQSITDQNFEEKLLEINTVLDNLYTNRDVNTAKADSKKAFKNVMSGKVGKLDKRGDRDKVMSSKIVNFTKLEPKRLKMVLDDADFEQYKDYISRLSGRGLTLSETDLKTIGELYDRISKPYSDYVAEVNRIQQIIDAGGTLTKGESDFIENNKSEFSERETPQTLADKEAKKLERDAKKEAEIAKKKASIKELLPLIKSVFESSNAVKGSLEWRILDALIGLSESDVDSMPDNMLTNALNAISSMVNDDVIPSYAEDLYKYKLKTDYKNALVETLKKAGKFGVYKLKVAKIPLKIREIIGLPLNPVALWNDIRKKNINQKIIDRRIKLFNLSSIDAAVKVYGDTPLFNAFMSSFGKAMSRIASAEEKVEAVLLKAKRDLDKNSKNPQESYMKIVYHLIDTMAKNNVGTTSSRSAMEYFEATINDPNSKISEDNYMKGLAQGFIDKVGANNNQIEDLTPEEANAANAIRMVLEENQINAYEANLFQNSNAAPMIVEYFPVFNSVVKQAENDLARLKSKFGIDSVSIKAGSLEDKTGTAHPIDLNPFTSAFSSVRNVLFQHQLRSEYAAITQAINEAIAENSTDNDVLPYLKGIQKALNSQFDLLINGAIHTEPTLTDKILNGTDRAFYTLALGSIISRGVDFAGNMVQLMTINPKYISYSNKVSNALVNIKEEGESETELIRSFYENAEASDVNKMISSKKINTERTEFINRGINKEVLSKGLPSSNAGAKLRAKITGPIRDTASGAVDTLLGFGDVKPYAISWNGVFYEEFLKQAGEEVDIEKIARGDVEYLKKYKDAISKASNKANQENADLYGSTNPMEKKVGIMEIASKKVKNSVPGAVNALVNKAAYLFASFDMNARNDMNTAVNTYIENQEGRNARRFLGGAIRLASYSLAINYIAGAIWGLFKGDDDDEEKLKVSFDKLSGDDDFIKEVNNFLLDYPIQKDADGNIIELNVEDLAKYDQIRYKLMQNKDFAAAYDIIYGYLNRDLFDNQVKNKIGEINNSKYEYDKSFVEVFFSDIDKGFGKSDDEIVDVLGLLNSQQGYKLFTEDEIDSYILKIEKYMADTNFLSNRATRESSKQIDKLIVTKAASILSDYRSNKSAEEVTTTEGLKLFMGMMFSRSNNFTKASYNFAAELANKQMIQSRRGERGYDAFKDNVFQTPIKAGLTKVAIKKQLTQDAFNILFPALTKMDKYMYTDYAVPDLVRFTPLGILGVNDFSKIDSKMKNDVIYQNTNGKYRDNIIKDIKETKIDILRSKENIEKDSVDNQFRKSRVIPGVKETKLKSRLPSYKEGKDLKVNGNRAN